MLVYVRPSNEVADDPSRLARSFFRDGGWLIFHCARRTRPFRSILPLCPKGSSQTVLHCAHWGSTFWSCGLSEQEGWSGCSPPTLLRPRVPRAQRISEGGKVESPTNGLRIL